MNTERSWKGEALKNHEKSFRKSEKGAKPGFYGWEGRFLWLLNIRRNLFPAETSFFTSNLKLRESHKV